MAPLCRKWEPFPRRVMGCVPAEALFTFGFFA